jgi:tetratricopeptide (TPR) repeat protein
LSESRTARIFLSSTFRDFGEERDLLVRKVFPALRAKLKDRFVELVDVDLRWGITAEEAERGEVLPICLAEIDRARPYFIGLLGERYGWVPEKGKYPASLLRERRWIKAHQGGKSVTELEILHGVLNDPAMAGRARFYVRSSVYARRKGGEYLPRDKVDRQRQQALKARVRQSGFPVVRYATPRDLAKRLERDLWAILDAQFPAEAVPDAFEREAMRHEAYAVPRRRLYLGGEGYLRALKALVRRGAPRILITGQSGGGKSALLANALVGMRPGKVHLFEHYLGASSDAADPVALVRRLIEFIRRTTDSAEVVPTDPQEILDSLSTWLAIASGYAQKHRTRWVFALDALNGLSSRRDLRWLPDYLPARVQLVISSLDGQVKEALETKGVWDRVAIEPLDRAGQQRLLSAYLHRYNKTLPRDLERRALEHPLAGNPLWLKTLAEELRLFGSHEELAGRLDVLLGPPSGKGPGEPATVDDLFEHVLGRVEGDQGRRLVRAALRAIWASRAGLGEPELLQILKTRPAVWASIRYALDEMLLESGGRLLFAHDYARVAVRDRYLPTEALQRAAHRTLARAFADMPIDGRVAEELPHQLREARAWRALHKTLTHPGIFWTLYTQRSIEEHLGYWLSLEAERGKPLLEQSMQRAWHRWKLPAKGERTGDLADAVASFLREAGRGLTGSFLQSLAETAFRNEERIYGVQHAATSSRLNNLASLLEAQGDYAAAEPLFRRALTIAEKTLGPEHPVTAIRLINLSSLLRNQGDYAAAEPLCRRSLEIAEKVQGPSDPNTGGILYNLAKLLVAKGDYAGAEPLYRRALAIVEKTQGSEHPLIGAYFNNLAELLKVQGDYAGAELLYRRALGIAEKTQGPAHPWIGAYYNNLAGLLKVQGDYAGAEPLYRRALAIAEKAQGPEHPWTGICLNNLASLLQSRGDCAGAESLYRQALTIAERVNGLEHPTTKARLSSLAGSLNAQGECASAEPLYRRALAIDEGRYGPNHEEVMETLTKLGGTLRQMGKTADAGDVLMRAVEVADKLNFGGPFFQLGQLRLDQKDYGDAERLLRRCLEIRREKLAPDDEAIRMTLESLAEVCRLTGREDEAKALLAEWRRP